MTEKSKIETGSFAEVAGPVKVKTTVNPDVRKDWIRGKTVILRINHDSESAFWNGAKENCFISEYEDAATGMPAYEIFKKPEANAG